MMVAETHVFVRPPTKAEQEQRPLRKRPAFVARAETAEKGHRRIDMGQWEAAATFE